MIFSFAFGGLFLFFSFSFPNFGSNSAHITLNVVSRLHGSASGECSESSVEDSLTRLLNAQETPSGATWADSRAWD